MSLPNPDGCESKVAPNSNRLTEPQRRHLAELLNPATGATRYWRPANAGERRCAAALRRMGLLEGSDVTYNDAFYLSADGLRIARGLMEPEPDHFEGNLAANIAGGAEVRP